MRALVVLLLIVAATGAAEPKLTQSAAPGFFVSEWRIADLNGDGRDDLLLVGTHGEVRSWFADARTGKLEAKPRGRLVVPKPRFTLLALADILGEGGLPQLVALSPDGAAAYRVGEDGAFGTEAQPLARRAKFRLRTNEPRLAAITQDINNDGRPDLVVPGRQQTDIWINGEKGLRRTARISTDLDRAEKMQADRLSDELSARFRIPRLQTQDVNGDSRPDLIVRSGQTRSFHIQREDGSIPPEPDVKLDLEIFKDTTPRADLRPGRVWAGSDRTRFLSRDLDNDTIPDYVIAHRRKVWVFHGNSKHPQFVEPTTILKVSDDVSALLAIQLSDDKFPDLLLFKVQIPTVAGVIAGLVSSMEIEISALGYRNTDGRAFERSPTWRSALTVKIPPILKLMKDAGELLGRVEKVGRKFRPQRAADLTGNGTEDIMLLSEDRKRIEFWFETGGGDAASMKIDLDQTVRSVVFEDPDKQWTIDRMLAFVAGFAEQRTTGLTGGRAADAALTLRDPKKFVMMDFSIADLDGDGASEVIIRYGQLRFSTGPVFDIIRVR